MTKELTLLVCCHNGAPYLRRMLESIFDQTLSPDRWQLLILFDACTDESERIFDEAWNDLCAIQGKKRDWLTHSILYKKEKRGLANAKNFALQYVDSPYVAYQDVDDLSLPQRLEIQLDYLNRRREIDALFTQAWDMDNHGRLLVNCFDINQYIYHDQIARALCNENVLMHGSAMIRMNALKDVEFYNESEKYKGMEDWMLWCKMIRSGKIFEKINERLCAYSLGTSVER